MSNLNSGKGKNSQKRSLVVGSPVITQNEFKRTRQIQDEGNTYEVEAKKIVNAYRQVEQLKVDKPKQAPKQDSSKHRPQSNYAAKVKETLSQLKSNKVKEGAEVSRLVVEAPVKVRRDNYDRKLYRIGLDRVFAVVQAVQARSRRVGWKGLREYVQEEQKKENEFIRKFRLFKIFKAWRDEAVLGRVQRQQERQSQQELGQMAKEFRVFTLLKKTFKGWSAVQRREVKRKAYEKQLRRMQLEQKDKEKEKEGKKKEGKKNPVEQNHQLQNKLRGFLDGLKDKVQNKDRLRTIKEHTEESDPNIRMHSDMAPSPEASGMNQLEQEFYEAQERRPEQQQEEEGDYETVIQPPQQQPYQAKKPMTNEELDNKRKELEGKHRKRKEALERLRKEKEDKRRQEERQRMQLQREVQAEQLRLKQERYRQYQKNKKEEEQWQIREKQLEIRASQFNAKRLMRWFGWQQLKNVKQARHRKAETTYQTLLLILFRVKASQFMQNIKNTASLILEAHYQRMQKRYERKILSKALSALWQNREQQQEQRADLLVRHEVNQLKIYFSEWKRVNPQLALENFDWERPRVKRAEEFRRMQLLFKSVSALGENRRREQEDRAVQMQKKRLEGKIKAMLGDEEKFDYNQYLSS